MLPASQKQAIGNIVINLTTQDSPRSSPVRREQKIDAFGGKAGKTVFGKKWRWGKPQSCGQDEEVRQPLEMPKRSFQTKPPFVALA